MRIEASRRGDALGTLTSTIEGSIEPNAKETMMNRVPGMGCLLFMALFWNGLVGVFDFTIGRGVWQSWKARSSFVEVPVEITRTDVEVDNSGDGTSYAPVVEYRYTVDGAEYIGDRVSYNAFASGGRPAARSVIAEYPVGATATALVDPDDPNEAVLDASLDSLPGAIILFLTPFHCIGLGLLISVFLGFRQLGSGVDPFRRRYVKVDTERHVVIARPMYSAPVVFLFVLLITSFLATFPVIFLLGFEAPLAQVFPILGGCVAVAGVFGLKRWRKRRSPSSYLHIDKVLGIYSYPADSEGERIEDVHAVTATSKATGTTINNVVQFHHRYKAETTNGDIELFDVKMGSEDGERLRELLEMELLAG